MEREEDRREEREHKLQAHKVQHTLGAPSTKDESSVWCSSQCYLYSGRRYSLKYCVPDFVLSVFYDIYCYMLFHSKQFQKVNPPQDVPH